MGFISNILDDYTFQQLKKSKYYHPEITDVIYDYNQMRHFGINSMYIAEKGFDSVLDSKMFALAWNLALKDGMKVIEKQVKEKDLKLRMVVEVTEENVEALNLLEFHDVKHLDEIRGNFSIFDNRAYMVYIFHQNSELPEQTLWSNVKIFADKQQAIFNRLWEISIPLSTRTKELAFEKDTDHERTLTNYQDIQNEVNLLIEQTRKKLIIFAHTGILKRIMKNSDFSKNILKLLKKEVLVKILIDDIDVEIIKLIRSINKFDKDNAIDFAYTNRLGDIKEFSIINDRNLMLQVKLEDNIPRSTLDNVVAVISNKEHKIAVQEILFEKYWNEVRYLSITANSRH